MARDQAMDRSVPGQIHTMGLAESPVGMPQGLPGALAALALLIPA